MSCIQVQDLVSYQLRTNYLNNIADGVGERLIAIDDGFLNAAGFKAAGWRVNPANIKRTHSPPIPTVLASEYFQAPPRSAGVAPNGVDDELEEGGMLTGVGAGDAVGTGLATKRRRRREQMEEEDSSDLSDDSDENGDQRAAQKIQFSKMPIRNRSGSSPLRSSNLRQSSTVPSPVRTGGQTRRGSQSALESVKERARRDTVTSSEMSSEGDFDNQGYHKRREANRNAAKASKALHRHTSDPDVGIQRQQSDLLEEEEEDSEASELDSELAGSIDSTSLLDEIPRPPIDAPQNPVVGTVPREIVRSPTKKSKEAPAKLVPLNDLIPLAPPRPVSLLPHSLIGVSLKSRSAKPALPFESFASLSGQGDPNPLNLRIWVPFAKSTGKPMSVHIRRIVHMNESVDRQVMVADLIGLSLWRYTEEKLMPEIPTELLNVNRWILRLIEDEEVDYDFPALERTKAVVHFTTANNKAARSRSNSKPFDEFALVVATPEEFQKNQTITPQFKQEAVPEVLAEDDITTNNMPKPKPQVTPQARRNPILQSMPSYHQKTSLADMPAATASTSPQATRSGAAKKLLRIHIHSTDATPGQMVTLDVTTDTYLADVLEMVCKKRQLDKANHVLKLTGSGTAGAAGTVVLLDRTVGSIGNQMELALFRRRFATDGPLTVSGSPSSSSPKVALLPEFPEKRKKRGQIMTPHPFAQDSGKQDEMGSGIPYKSWTVNRRQPLQFAKPNEMIISLDRESLQIQPASSAKTFNNSSKLPYLRQFPWNDVVGCKIKKGHPTAFKIVVYKTKESKRYDFEAKSANDAADIVFEITKAISPNQNL